MLSALIAAAEPSKTPFYLVGGVLAVWAVVLASLGLTRPAFPYDMRGQRVVILISLVLVIGALVAAVGTDP